MLALLSLFSPASMLITLIKIFSTLWTGDHLSLASSHWFGLLPGECRIDMQTAPSL
jgi:hypothetical protein